MGREIVENIKCDTCGAVLEGFNGAARVKRDYLQLKDFIYAIWNDDLQMNVYMHGVRLDKLSGTKITIDVCDTECLKSILEEKRTVLYPRIVEKLKDQRYGKDNRYDYEEKGVY